MGQGQDPELILTQKTWMEAHIFVSSTKCLRGFFYFVIHETNEGILQTKWRTYGAGYLV